MKQQEFVDTSPLLPKEDRGVSMRGEAGDITGHILSKSYLTTRTSFRYNPSGSNVCAAKAFHS